MIDMQKDIELLAPAGTYETFWAAIENGADAVYLGLKDLNARALARNFTLEEIADLTHTAHLKGRKVFVAMNSLMKEDEIPKAIDALSALHLIGVDALIIQDLGIWRLARTYFPGLHLHASTLMAIHNSFGVRMAKRMGFKRVVLAREMTLHEIRAATACQGIEIEVFVHGAMCFGYSGLCLFSSYFGGKSGLRGRCVQPCRRRYEWGGKTGAYLSMGDLSGLEAVDELRQVGIKSLKIEGRLRPPHYIASIVKAYRMIIDHPGDPDMLSAAQELAGGALGRPYTRGYFKGTAPRDAILPWRMTNTGAFVGRVIDYKGERLLVNARLRPEEGDRLRIVYHDRESQQSFLCVGLNEEKNGNVWIRANTSFKDAKNALIFRADIARSVVLQDIPAKKTDTDKKKFKIILKKARLTAIEIIKRLPGEDKTAAGDIKAKNRYKSVNIWVKVSDPHALSLVRGFDIKGIMLSITHQNLRLLKDKAPRWLDGMTIVWSLPAIIPEDQTKFYKDAIRRLAERGFYNFEAANLGAVNLLKETLPGKVIKSRGQRLIFGSYTLNLLNSQALIGIRELGVDRPQFSIETDIKNVRHAMLCAPSVQTSLTIFAYLPIITSRMDLSAFSRRGPIISPKGERFYWHRETSVENAGVLLPDKPFSLLNRQAELKGMGFSDWIIDLSHWIKSKHMPKGTRGDKVLFNIPAKAFNFFGTLE